MEEKKQVILGCCRDKQYGHGCDETTCMRLPDGQTCGACVHLKRCLAFGFTRTAEAPHCDFFPRRFQLRVVAGSPA